MIPQNTENFPLSDSVSYSRRLELLASSLWESQILQDDLDLTLTTRLLVF
jgi:hypothetical protein